MSPLCSILGYYNKITMQSKTRALFIAINRFQKKVSDYMPSKVTQE